MRPLDSRILPAREGSCVSSGIRHQHPKKSQGWVPKPLAKHGDKGETDPSVGFTPGGKLGTTVDDRIAVPAEDPSPETRLRQHWQLLLEAYQADVLAKVEHLPFRTKVGPRSKGPLGRHWQSRFRWRWLLRYFVVDHIRRNLAAIKRQYHLQAALAEDPAGPERELAALENYEKSLPPVGVSTSCCWRSFWSSA
jgi:hypothetical protein